jgi:hypothetical protein
MRGAPAEIEADTPDVGDLIVLLLTSTLAGLRDRLYDDGFDRAADLVEDLVEIADDYVFGDEQATRPDKKDPRS